MYSNVTPPTLPSYDSVANPYYLIQFEYAIGAEDWSTVRLWYGSAPLTWNGSAVTNSVDFSLYTYGTGSPEWTAWVVMAEAGEMALTPGPTTADTYMRLYTNHDIKDGTGAVWLAANTVTPTEADKESERLNRIKSQLAGFIAAWCSPSRSFPNREPVAFLYGHEAKEGETPTHTINGVDYVGAVLPDIFKVYTPELQKSHPFAYIGNGMGYFLFLTTAPCKVEKIDEEVGANTGAEPGTGVVTYWASPYGTEWTKQSEGEVSGNYGYWNPLWANYDVEMLDGTPFLDKSAPVPVYE